MAQLDQWYRLDKTLIVLVKFLFYSRAKVYDAVREKVPEVCVVTGKVL